MAETTGKTSEAMDVIKFIPGIGLVVPAVTYMVLANIDIWKLVEGLFDMGSDSFITDLLTSLVNVGDTLSPTSGESEAATALQVVFGPNLYCNHQKIYREESEYISKQEASPDGGYNLFPIYPMAMEIDRDTGQCNRSAAIDDRFININNPKGASNLNPSISKCSYSFSATDEQCLLDLNIPIFSLYVAEIPVTEAACTSKKNNKKSASKVKKALKNAKKISAILLEGATELFLDDKMALDPVTMLSLFSIEGSIEVFSVLKEILTNIMKGLPQVASCITARLISLQTVYYASLSIIAGMADANYGKAKQAAKDYTFCGSDWLSYKETDDKKYWVKGAYCGVGSDDKNDGGECYSYYRKVIEDVEKGSTPKDIKEVEFREYSYGGKEYDAGFPENAAKNKNKSLTVDYDVNYCYDPRIAEQRGFDDSITQRYYMRGNDKANFACNRFFYDGINGCVLPGSALTSPEKNISTLIKTSHGNYYQVPADGFDEKCKSAFEKARQCCEYRSRHLICLEKTAYSKKVGTGKKSSDQIEQIKKSTIHEKGDYTFCLSHVFESYQDGENSNLFAFLRNKKKDKYGPTCELEGIEFDAAKKINTNYVCVYSYGLCPFNFKLNAGLNYRASYCDANYFSNYSDRSDVIQREATHFNRVTCEEGLFSEAMRDRYKELFGDAGKKVAAYTYARVREDMAGFNKNDFDTIYDFSKNHEVNEKVKTCGMEKVDADFSGSTQRYMRYDLNPLDVFYFKSSAFGQVKNFCQYRAHCVEVEREQEYADNYMTGSLFLDSSCSGKTSNSRNRFPADTGNILRQFSAPIAECIFESLKNLVNGVAGISLCENGESPNSKGYCGSDTEDKIKTQYENGNSAFFKDRYQKIDGQYIIKGYSLPLSQNPFLKVQKYFVNVVKAALALFLVLFFYKKLLMGDLASFTKPENMSKLVFTAFKLSLVLWLIFYNGWQSGVYTHLVNFATASYTFINNIFAKSVDNPKNMVLNLDGNVTLRIVEKDTTTPVLLCYKYDAMGNIYYARGDLVINDVRRRCPKGYNTLYSASAVASEADASFQKATEIKVARKQGYKKQNPNVGMVIENNQEIAQLIKFIEEYNEGNSVNLVLQIKTQDGKAWDSVANSVLWNPSYDGCYFDSTEYKEDKSYLASFDMLDCKLVRYIGYSTGNAAPSLILYSMIMLVPNFIFPDGIVTKVINAIGSTIFGLMMTFLFVIFNIILKAVYIFTSSFFILSVLVFISPIVLPLMFFEKTKGIFDTWLEYMMETIFKPVLNFAFLVIYVNLMDIILLKNVTFNKHGINGRGANILCPENSSSFLCLINGIPGIQQIKVLFNSGFKQVLIDIVIIFIFFKLSDQLLEDIEKIAGSIFKSISDPNKKSPSSLGITNRDAHGNVVDGVSGGIAKAMETGAKIETFRHDYVNNIPGTVISKIPGLRDVQQKTFELRENLINRATELKEDAKRYAKDKLMSAKDALTLKDWREDRKAGKKLDDAVKYKENYEKFKALDEDEKEIKKKLAEKNRDYNTLKYQEKDADKSEIKALETEMKSLRKQNKRLERSKNKFREDYNQYVSDMNYVEKHGGKKTFRKIDEMLQHTPAEGDNSKKAQKAITAQRTANDFLRDLSNNSSSSSSTALAKKIRQTLKDTEKLLRDDEEFRNMVNESSDSEDLEERINSLPDWKKQKTLREQAKKYSANMKLIEKYADDNSLIDLDDELAADRDGKRKDANSILRRVMEERVKMARTNKAMKENMEMLQEEMIASNEAGEDENDLQLRFSEVKASEKYQNNLKIIENNRSKKTADGSAAADYVDELLDNTTDFEEDENESLKSMATYVSKADDKIKNSLKNDLQAMKSAVPTPEENS